MSVWQVFLIMAVIFCTVSDLKHHVIPNSCLTMLLILGLIHISIEMTYGYLMMSIILVAAFTASRINLGGGDIKLISVIPLYLLNETGMFLFWLCISYLWYHFTGQGSKRQRAFAPAILFSVIMTMLCNV